MRRHARARVTSLIGSGPFGILPGFNICIAIRNTTERDMGAVCLLLNAAPGARPSVAEPALRCRACTHGGTEAALTPRLWSAAAPQQKKCEASFSHTTHHTPHHTPHTRTRKFWAPPSWAYGSTCVPKFRRRVADLKLKSGREVWFCLSWCLVFWCGVWCLVFF